MDVSGAPVVKNPPSNARDKGLTLSQGTKSSYASKKRFHVLQLRPDAAK